MERGLNWAASGEENHCRTERLIDAWLLEFCRPQFFLKRCNRGSIVAVFTDRESTRRRNAANETNPTCGF